jgi:hypothetical protein
MRKRNLIIQCGMILALAVAILLFIFTRPTRPLEVTVAFVGYTNDFAGERFARFAITNMSSVTIRRWDRYQIEIPKQVRPGALHFRGQNAVLDPGRYEEFTIPVPTNDESWRVVFHCSPYDIRQDFADWANRSGYWRCLPQRLRGLTGQVARSDWIKR